MPHRISLIAAGHSAQIGRYQEADEWWEKSRFESSEDSLTFTKKTINKNPINPQNKFVLKWLRRRLLWGWRAWQAVAIAAAPRDSCEDTSGRASRSQNSHKGKLGELRDTGQPHPPRHQAQSRLAVGCRCSATKQQHVQQLAHLAQRVPRIHYAEAEKAAAISLLGALELECESFESTVLIERP